VSVVRYQYQIVGLIVMSLGVLITQAAPAESPSWPVPPLSKTRAPTIPAKAWLLMDYHNGWVLAHHRGTSSLAIASLTKVMTAYLVFDRLRSGDITLGDKVVVSKKAWSMSGARMFLPAHSRVRLEFLLKGMIIGSANDAAVALAEHIDGSEQEFVKRMNRVARELGLTHTFFGNSTGLPTAKNRSSAYDLGRLASLLIREFPKFYVWFGEKEFEFRKIRSYNRNSLLWQAPGVDGVKTGQSRAAGYCFIATTQRQDMRLIAILLGTSSRESRNKSMKTLLDFGFKAYETRFLLNASAVAARTKVFNGSSYQVDLGLMQALHVTLPRGTFNMLSARVYTGTQPSAPIKAGQQLGHLALNYAGQQLGEYPLLALYSVSRGKWYHGPLHQLQQWWE